MYGYVILIMLIEPTLHVTGMARNVQRQLVLSLFHSIFVSNIINKLNIYISIQSDSLEHLNTINSAKQSYPQIFSFAPRSLE